MRSAIWKPLSPLCREPCDHVVGIAELLRSGGNAYRGCFSRSRSAATSGTGWPMGMGFATAPLCIRCPIASHLHYSVDTIERSIRASQVLQSSH